ncbi:MAG: polyprenyl diphosphate synthase [Thermomicrobiales bacterium]
MSHHESTDSEPLASPDVVPTCPSHVAIIMDGNGRWAAKRGMARIEGHEAGTENIRRITFQAGQLGIKYLTLWAFSTENWRRPEHEVNGILEILGRAIASETEDLHAQGAQLRHIGDLDALEPHLRQSIRDAIDLTQYNDRLVLTLAFNYGGRHEIVRAVQRIVEEGIAAGEITEATIADRLYTSDIPDPDLIIRTSGEFRTSNFLIWQAAYAEWIFTSKFWPDFGPDDLTAAVEEYAGRDRRYGALPAASPAKA